MQLGCRRELEVLDALTSRCRVLTIDQVGRLAGMGRAREPREKASRELVARLRDKGMLEVVRALARPPLPLLVPELIWNPGEPVPDFRRVSYRLQRRWTVAPRKLSCVVASRAALRLFGSRTKPLSHPLQFTHDLGLAEVYLRFRSLDPGLSACWRGEDALDVRPARGRRLPDAALCTRDGAMFLAVEFGGAYEPSRLESLHRAFAGGLAESSKPLPYQVW